MTDERDDSNRKPGGASTPPNGFGPRDLIFGALVIPYGSLMYVIGGWTVALGTAAGLFLVAVVWTVWQVWFEVSSGETGDV